MKKFLRLGILTLLITCLFSCGQKDERFRFSQSEYYLRSGEKVMVTGRHQVEYYLVRSAYEAVKVEAKTGVITFENTVPHGSQILVGAKSKKYSALPVVVTLMNDLVAPELTFEPTIEYLMDGDHVIAYSSVNSAIAYHLKEEVAGVRIDQITGRLTIRSFVSDGTLITITISSLGVQAEKTFIVAKTELARAKNTYQVMEEGSHYPVYYHLDFSDFVSPQYEKKVRAVFSNRRLISEDLYSFDPLTACLKFQSEIADDLAHGESTLHIVTGHNIVNVTLIKATKLIKTAADLQGINHSKETLSGYYVLANDIDLTSYLAPGGAGYNHGRGWKPIGIYHDVNDGTALAQTFNGTFDGNGHTISGFFINRCDELAYNAGLFGYVNHLGVIKNLGLVDNGTVSQVRSFSGSIAGVNAGTIQNCWSDVDVNNDYGEKNFHSIGGFVGNNFGVIENSYCLGKATGEDLVGVFAGMNQGIIRHCYGVSSLEGEFNHGLPALNSAVLSDLSDLQTADLDPAFWEFNGEQPTLKSLIPFYLPLSLRLKVGTKQLVRGESTSVDVEIYPSSLQAAFASLVVYTLDGSGCLLSAGTLTATLEAASQCQIKAELYYDGVTLVDQVTVEIFDPVASLILDETLPDWIEPSRSYLLKATVLPETAIQEVTWEIMTPNVIGAQIIDNLLIIDETIERLVGNTITLRASAGNEEITKELILNRPQYFGDQKVWVLYEDESDDLILTLPASVDLTNVKVYRQDRELPIAISGQQITIAAAEIKTLPEITQEFCVRLADQTYYRAYACYFSHPRPSIDHIAEDYLEISSVADFKHYFNLVDFDVDRYENYDKTFVLTADIDFAGEKIFSIGFTTETGESHPFTGKIYGLGHTIKNARITDSESYFTLSPEAQASAERSSRYQVGFFGALNGQLFDVHFENIQVEARSWCGCLAGIIGTQGYLENVNMINCQVLNANDVDYSTADGLKTGRMTAENHGVMLAVSYNGKIIGLVG
ncbi:MAG: hypothetical protein ACOX3K_05320 [Bacilli bacterium]